MSERKRNKVYSEEFKRQAVELLINSGKPQAQLARELGCSDMSLSGWKRKYLKSLAPAKLEGGPQQPEELVATIKQQQKEIEYLRRQREILKKAMSILPGKDRGEIPSGEGGKGCNSGSEKGVGIQGRQRYDSSH
jgi:transposase